MTGGMRRFEPGDGRHHGPQCRLRCQRACPWAGAELCGRSRPPIETDAARACARDAKRWPDKVCLEAPSGRRRVGWRRVGGRSRSRHSGEGGKGRRRDGDSPRRGPGGSLTGEAGRPGRGEASARSARDGGGGVGQRWSRDTRVCS
jgi:hypothetical protein